MLPNTLKLHQKINYLIHYIKHSNMHKSSVSETHVGTNAMGAKPYAIS